MPMVTYISRAMAIVHYLTTVHTLGSSQFNALTERQFKHQQ